MKSTVSAAIEVKEQQQRKHTSVFKAMLPRGQKHITSATTVTSPSKPENGRSAQELRKGLPMVPLKIPNANIPLAEVNRNRERTRSSPRKSIDVYDEERNGAVGLEGTQRYSKREIAEQPKQKSVPSVKEKKPVKTKSSTNLTTLFARSKSSKSLKLDEHQEKKEKGKENLRPPTSADGAPTPIWAHFASTRTENIESTQKVPLNDRWDIEDEVGRYTPQEYSPSKGRNFFDEQPTLSRRAEPKTRPKSAYLPTSISAASFTDTISVLRKVSQRHKKNDVGRFQDIVQKDVSASRRSSTDSRRVSNNSSQADITMVKRGSRVMAAVAALNGKMIEPEKGVKQAKTDSDTINSAFEAVLESRNIEQNVREKMRSLDTNIKADFIKKNSLVSASSSNNMSLESPNLSRPSTGKLSRTDDKFVFKDNTPNEAPQSESPKKLRPRSLTFTLSRADQSSRKQKTERPASHIRTKSATIVQSTSSSSLNASFISAASGFMTRAQKQPVPEDFISYLRKYQRPQLVEVGKLQKLRQLLRNETVTWVDSFIMKGGVDEIVGLLYRIIDIEWREEHEDTLMHHTLTCLKALFTTSLALSHLLGIQATLFPILLRLLFSSGEEKKGPSEFSTRGIIISLLFTYLSTSQPHELPIRARTLLSYLRDPILKEEERPPGFIADMHRPRPYKLWCKEISNVTKEVFWIFLHHLNVVPYPPPPTVHASYSTTHFPAPRPPVPAAPYVGGVEWEATTYLATHLDLLNGLLAALPSREERNALRVELRDSGFEKVMGEALRTCKEKFYGGVHAGLGTWAGAAREDGWDTAFVREGPKREEVKVKVRSPKKKDQAPKLEGLKLEVGELDLGAGLGDGEWF